ncbi:hypothetical protein HD554DRAFT_861014 [Boletus coccyginus]|nr:hypothetical protein HD554DRAFT_861014 [Boletus coccyginus]
MSTTDSTSNLEMTSSPTFVHTSESFQYAVTHVFLPLWPPKKKDYIHEIEKDDSLARAVCAAAHAYTPHVYGASELAQWHRITKILDNLQASTGSGLLPNKDQVISQLRGMQTGDILAFFIRPKNTATILTKQENFTLCESFEVSPSSDAVQNTAGSLICSYPWLATETPNEVFGDGGFQSELANFLSRPDSVCSNLSPPAHPPFITSLTGILRGVGRPSNVLPVTKHVRDYVGRLERDEKGVVWRRSSLWLLIRVTIQMSVDPSPLGRAAYKRFVLFFVCMLSRDRNNADLSSDLLHLMSSKVLRRLTKLGSSAPHWLSEMALKTCACLGEILGARWKQLSAPPSPFWSPSQDELSRDTRLTLLNSDKYIRNALANPAHESVSTPFHPNHHRRGSIEDFLSSNGSFFREAYCVDPDVALFDLKRSVEQGIDDWLACVTNVNEACAQLCFLMDQYVRIVESYDTSEDGSNMLLTAIELYVALDKLVVKEIPMLADYSPEIPIAGLETLLLRKMTSLHRLSCAYRYLSMRHSQSNPGWSVLSDKFTEDSFPVRYYDQSPHLQRLKARIEEETTGNVGGLNGLVAGVKVSRSPLPSVPLLAKVVVFELQSPACLLIWRSVTATILPCFGGHHYRRGTYRKLIADVRALRPYFVRHLALPLHFHLAYSHPKNSLSYTSSFLSGYGRMRIRPVLEYYSWGEYVESTFHTSNNVFAAQVDCPKELTLDEFITFAHLRSGGSLQWLNILWGLRSRTLNLHREQVHDLLTYAAFQVGPLDLNTGAWIWHQELQDSCFCNALLEELESLFVDVGACAIDAVLMGSIALLLTRVLASNPGEDVSERTTALLRSVRKRTFSWVQELLCDMAVAPTNEQRSRLLVNMAATCRSTFNVDPAILSKHVCSAEDVDALLSCTFINALCGKINRKDSFDTVLSLSLEEILRDEILADPSDYGVDLAVAKIFVSHKPCLYRWEQLQCANARWLVCQTTAVVDYPSQSVHINLLSGEFRVGGRVCAVEMPDELRDSCGYEFYGQGFLLVPSNLSGMDFAIFSVGSEHKVHFSLQNGDLVVRAQCHQTNDIFQLIPSRKLLGDLPSSLVNGHIHWLNLSTSIIEIRPLEKLWEESSENWKIDCKSGQYRMYKGHKTLVDIRSPTWAVVSKRLANFCKCLDNLLPIGASEQRRCWNILITTSSIDSVPRLSVALPHYGLSFFVNARDELGSRDFKDMVYDEDQSIGTLFGIENLLVLRPKSHLAGCLLPEALIPRRVLIPNGELLTERNDGFGTSGALYYTYEVDTELGCLTGDGSLESTRYLAYLHAVTSCYRPDPLTGKTGVQAGLSLLQSARCRSIMKLETPSDSGMNANKVILWGSITKYPQINIAHDRIQQNYYWSDGRLGDLDGLVVGRASHLFPWNVTATTSPEDPDSTCLPERSHLGLEDILSSTASNTLTTLPHLVPSVRYTSSERAQWPITLDQLLFDRLAPELPPRHNSLPTSHKTSSGDIPELNQLFSHLQIKRTDPPFKERYLTLLGSSAGVSKEFPQFHIVAGKDRIDTLQKHYVQCGINYKKALRMLKERLGPTTNREQALDQFGQWPPITPEVLLQCLASNSATNLPDEWKKCITLFALLLLDVQRARRLLRFALDGLEEEFSKELENEGCDGCDSEKYLDWLLIQIQGNFRIRRNQAETAMEMISPQSGKNTVMQMNMGDGKSSVIIPMTAAALADGKQLVRVIVPKVLTVQMFELLVARLGGLTNRPIYHLPFSRTPEYTGHGKLQIDDLRKLMSRCMAERGILLVQPEDVVSLKLMSMEQQIHKGKLAADPFSKLHQTLYEQVAIALSLRSIPECGVMGSLFRGLGQSPNHPRTKDAVQPIEVPRKLDSASKWVSLQKWMHSHVRDIVDESDEIFHPRFQLIYTIGLEQYMDGYPERWTITQQVLRLVKHHADTISRNHPASMEYECGPPGSFPHVRIVRVSEVGRRLISSIVEDVMDGRLPKFNFQHVSVALHDAIRSFISDPLAVPDTAKVIEEYAKGSDQNHLWSGLLLLRGLLASNMLLFALTKRRWRVDYGLDGPTPAMLAVPYRAKDVPAPNCTQFGHPDLAIILTCLSYYYGGLSEEQLRVTFEILLEQDDPSTEYALWVNECGSGTLPDSFRSLSGINLESSEKWDNVMYPRFSESGSYRPLPFTSGVLNGSEGISLETLRV